jgi:methylthioribose-1-phosphate isomerase
MQRAALDHRGSGPQAIKQALFNCAQEIIEDDRRVCRQIGRYGQDLIKKNASVLTVCNAGMLATIDYGTALGVLYSAKAKGRQFSVYACETRPLLQGARLTTWELRSNGIPVTLICDNMAATLMQQKKVDIVIAGADRITSSGDVANKIGTYSLAVLCAYHKIPFYIAAPISTFDVSLAHGKDITIEQRASEEVTHLFYKKPMAPKGVTAYNPAFDVTDHSLITGIITEFGIIRPPYARNIEKIIGKK